MTKITKNTDTSTNKQTPMTHEEAMALPKQQFIDRCSAWLNEFNDGQPIKVKTPVECPVHIWVETNRQACGHELVANTMFCEICGEACCPDCLSHNVQQISRVMDIWEMLPAGMQGKNRNSKRGSVII